MKNVKSQSGIDQIKNMKSFDVLKTAHTAPLGPY